MPATARMSFDRVSARAGLVGLMSNATLVALGTISRSSSSRFGPTSTAKVVTSVGCRPAGRGWRQARLDWVDPDLEDDRNARGRRFCRECGRSATDRGNHGHLLANQISRQGWQAIVLTLRPSIFDRHIPVLDIVGLAQALTERA